LRFSGIVLAVLVANLLTIGLLAGSYFYLKSDHGQTMLYEMGLHSFFIASIVTPGNRTEREKPSNGFAQPRLSDMQPMAVTPGSSSTRSLQSTRSSDVTTQSSSDRKRSQSAIRSSLKMCRFWNTEYRKDGAPQSKTYRDAACNRYERFSGRDSDNLVNLASSSSAPSQTSYREQQEIRDREREEERKVKEKREHHLYCERLSDRVDHYDSLLRRGGSAHYVNRLRRERREFSLDYSRKCLLGQ
jgi:hypothetical protein